MAHAPTPQPQSQDPAPAPAPALAPIDGPLLAEVHARRAAFRKQQDGMMRSELSPLGRVGFLHVDPGEQQLVPGKSAADLALQPAAARAMAPALAHVVSDRGARTLRVTGPTELRLAGGPPDARPLRNQDVLALGDMRLLVVGQPDDPSLAVYDLAAPPRRDYQGLHYFPDDDRYVVRARLRRYDPPRPVHVDASRGEPKELRALGTLHFSVLGTPCTMEAYAEGDTPDRLFLIFRDQTSGRQDPAGGKPDQAGGRHEKSYGAGRFLYAQVGTGDEVVLDFNQAWNPLCAYSVYFHCPLPPRSNWLPVELPVGESIYVEHDGGH